MGFNTIEINLVTIYHQESPISSRKVLIENSLEEMTCMEGTNHTQHQTDNSGQEILNTEHFSIVFLWDYSYLVFRQYFQIPCDRLFEIYYNHIKVRETRTIIWHLILLNTAKLSLGWLSKLWFQASCFPAHQKGWKLKCHLYICDHWFNKTFN